MDTKHTTPQHVTIFVRDSPYRATRISVSEERNVIVTNNKLRHGNKPCIAALLTLLPKLRFSSAIQFNGRKITSNTTTGSKLQSTVIPFPTKHAATKGCTKTVTELTPSPLRCQGNEKCVFLIRVILGLINGSAKLKRLR